MLIKESLIVNTILDYEFKFNGWLKRIYKDDEEFLNDLTNVVNKENGIDELLKYYKIHLINMNDTNSTSEKRLEIRKIISLLENQ